MLLVIYNMFPMLLLETRLQGSTVILGDETIVTNGGFRDLRSN
jgi:hypothetical protein